MDANQRESALAKGTADMSDLLRRLDLDAAATVGVADGDGESVTGVGLRHFLQAEHDFDHVAHLILPAPPRPVTDCFTLRGAYS